MLAHVLVVKFVMSAAFSQIEIERHKFAPLMEAKPCEAPLDHLWWFGGKCFVR